MTTTSSTPVLIRTARPADAEALASLAGRLFDETYAAHNRSEDMAAYAAEHFTTRSLLATLEDPAQCVILAEAGGTMLGYALLRKEAARPAAVAPGPSTELARLYVDGPWQGHGVAARLLGAAIVRARDDGAAALWLAVWSENPRAIRFYEKHGFRIVGSQLFRLGSDIQDDYLMALPLGSSAPERHSGRPD
jgi:diamine N-acetyltransferase